jgi:tRNA A37 methylthiotransferase MiaB
VGFPGETDRDFAATMDLIRAVGFGAAFSFKYSARPGTPAAEKDPVPAAVADERLQALQALVTSQQRALQEAMVGREVGVLYEKPGRLPGQMVGKSDHLHAVHVDDPEGRGACARDRQRRKFAGGDPAALTRRGTDSLPPCGETVSRPCPILPNRQHSFAKCSAMPLL